MGSKLFPYGLNTSVADHYYQKVERVRKQRGCSVSALMREAVVEKLEKSPMSGVHHQVIKNTHGRHCLIAHVTKDCYETLNRVIDQRGCSIAKFVRLAIIEKLERIDIENLQESYKKQKCTHTVSTHVPQQYYDTIERLAKERGMRMSELLREVVCDNMGKIEEKYGRSFNSTVPNQTVEKTDANVVSEAPTPPATTETNIDNKTVEKCGAESIESSNTEPETRLDSLSISADFKPIFTNINPVNTNQLNSKTPSNLVTKTNDDNKPVASQTLTVDNKNRTVRVVDSKAKKSSEVTAKEESGEWVLSLGGFELKIQPPSQSL